ncbi:MAG: type II secretion system major pseudopilin GspG [Phycisphaerae bacterium]
MYPARRLPARRRGRGAFTLLEILLVVGLLALLAAFVVPSLTSQSEAARVDLARAAIGPNGPLSQAIDLYKVNIGQFPEELKFLVEKPDDDDIAAKWRGPYIKDAGGLKDPWDRDFQYDPDGEHHPDGGVDLWSMGPDGIDGNEDDIANWESDR